MKIGLTGGIASGKTTVAGIFEKLGAYVINADQIAHMIIRPEYEGYDQIIRAFGTSFLKDDRTIDRKKLGEYIFSDQQARETLNLITHPLIRKELIKAMEQGPPFCVVEVPLLYENYMNNLFDEIVVVYIPQLEQLQRLVERNQLTEQEARARIYSQMDIENKKKLADYVINNQNDLKDTCVQVEKYCLKKGLL